MTTASRLSTFGRVLEAAKLAEELGMLLEQLVDDDELNPFIAQSFREMYDILVPGKHVIFDCLADAGVTESLAVVAEPACAAYIG